jgi:hypothetical protein
MALESEDPMNQAFEQIMQDSSIRKVFGERVKQLRKEKSGNPTEGMPIHDIRLIQRSGTGEL